MTELVACEFEDSTNCVWNAQEQGNGEGNSFVDIDGSVHYVDDPTVYSDVWVWEDLTGGINELPFQYVWGDMDGEPYMVIIWDGEVTITCPENKVPGWLDENGNPQGCVDNNPTPLKPKEEMPAPTPVETVETAAPVQVEELAVTGTAEVVTGALVGIALVVAGVVLYLKGRKK